MNAIRLKWNFGMLAILVFSIPTVYGHTKCKVSLPLGGWTEGCVHFHGNETPSPGGRPIDEWVKTIQSYLSQGLVPPVVREYFTYLDRQARYKRLPSRLNRILVRHYSDVSLPSVRYAENVDTLHGQGITVGDAIYFPESVDFNNYSDFHWLLHELEHVSQYQAHGGKASFVVKYLANGALEIGRNGSLNIHDAINLERDAENKANRVANTAWNSWSNTGAPSSPPQNANRYALACFVNDTQININYLVKWGEGEWENNSVDRGRGRSHAWKYDRPNENRSPNLYVRFDHDLRRNGSQYKKYKINIWSHPNTDCSSLGKKEHFRYFDGKSKIDLY